MAAPKSLQPSETRERVRGMMWDSVRESKVEMRVVGEWGLDVADMVGWGRDEEDFVIENFRFLK